MSITILQIPQALTAIDALTQTLNDMRMLVSQAKELSDKGWQIDIGVRGPLIVTITPTQQGALVAQYDTFKTQLVSTFQTLP